MAYDPLELTDERRQALEAFAAGLGLSMKRVEFLSQSLTHRSYAFENPPAEDNERLEFLGDSVLGFVTADYFFQRYPGASEGDLSKRKARVVSRAMLGRLAVAMGLGDHIRLGRGEERTGGRRRVSLLGSSLEAVIGAIYLSDGFEAAAQFIRDQLLERLVAMLSEEEDWDYKSRLQELAQKQFRTTPIYQPVATAGPDHDKKFTIRVVLAGRSYPEQTAPRKKTAENLAACAALEIIEAEQAAAKGE